jgi:hypothetical protein
MPRCELGERVSVPAEDLDYQFLVGFGAQSPPCPATRRQTQHNCLLIRISSLTVTQIFAQSMPSGTRLFTREIGPEINNSVSNIEKVRQIESPLGVSGQQIACLATHIYHDGAPLFDDSSPSAHDASLLIVGKCGDAREEFGA